MEIFFFIGAYIVGVAIHIAVKKNYRKNSHTVIVKKDDCKSKTVLIESKTSAGWIVFDVVFNIFAIAVDAPTGAWKTFDKSNVVVDLDCE